MAEKDLVVKMTINDKDFQNGLQNAKQSVKNFDTNSGLSALTKKIGALGLALKAVDIAKDTFIKGINSTEQSADSAASSMRSLTKSYDAVIQALANGNTGMSLTIDNLAMIAQNAKAAYEALDKLSTFQMWSTADRSIINAQIAEDRVIVNSKTATEEEKKAAQGRIYANVKRLDDITQQYLNNTKNAQVAVLREIGKASQDVNDEMLANYVESWKSGTLEKEAQKFWAENATTSTRYFQMTLGDQTWQQGQEYTTWSSPQAEAQYQAMMSLIHARETDEGWAEYFKLVKEEGQIRTEIANTVNKANKATQKTIESTKSGYTVSTKSSEGLTLDQQIQLLSRSLQYELLNNEHLKDIAVIDFDIPEEEIEDDAATIEKAVAAARQRMEELALATKQAFGAADQLAAAFLNMGKIADGTLGDVFTMLGSVIGQIISTMQAMMTLAGAETIEGVADVFANSPGGVWTKLALAGAGAAGILGIIASVKSSFAGSFAQGGVVGGTSYTGDNLIARVNSGELIVPYNDWHNAGTRGGNVHFVIEGSQLRGVMDNYDKTTAL